MLVNSLKTMLGSTIVYAQKVQGFHWNVEGPDFPQLHELFGEIYETVDGTVDKMAEYIRILDNYSPGTLKRFVDLSKISEQEKIPRAELMVKELLADSEMMCELASDLFNAATADGKHAIANFAADLMDIHDKYSWFLRSILKKNRA